MIVFSGTTTGVAFSLGPIHRECHVAGCYLQGNSIALIGGSDSLMVSSVQSQSCALMTCAATPPTDRLARATTPLRDRCARGKPPQLVEAAVQWRGLARVTCPYGAYQSGNIGLSPLDEILY